MCDEKNNGGKKNWFIYCSGPILRAAQYNQAALGHNDSKYFVDMPLKKTPDETNAAYQKAFGNVPENALPIDALKDFIEEYFSEPGTEMDTCEPEDWKENPPNFQKIHDPDLRKFANDLNDVWKTLCRQMKDEVKNEPDRFSLLYVPNQFIIPGGRFREFYYWDAYWIVKGLLASDMKQTAKNMIANLLYMVEQNGFVPNGGRLYYLQRSQPPLLTGMMFEYYQKTGDLKFLTDSIETLEKELKFWDDNRNVSVILDNQSYMLYQYRPTSNTPRPEGYLHDYTATLKMNGEKDKQNYYQNVAATAESGWDFSTRWYNNSISMDTIKTTEIVPVDLNSFIHWNLKLLGYFYREIGNTEKMKLYEERAARMRDAIKAVFYDKEQKAFFDYHLDTKRRNDKFFYASTAAPLFAEAYDLFNGNLPNGVYKYMLNQSVLNFPEGVPTSMVPSGEQWDFPNGWSPLEHIVIEGFRKSSDPEAQQAAFLLAEKWVIGNYLTWMKTKAMWEKYDISGVIPEPGHGGLYDVQVGFGWTNGVVLDLLITYGDRLSITKTDTSTKSSSISTKSLCQKRLHRTQKTIHFEIPFAVYLSPCITSPIDLKNLCISMRESIQCILVGNDRSLLLELARVRDARCF
ncbi:unnamed protein product, partial [Mesorhabditis belari]|uniref:Trehalase n=1 Tax=Mesorhabditis belari TaxID=2138241 RepID=A0AAF3FQU9_9BILA